jgi:tetratricopeptide (TPR) repeat protein
MEKGIYNPDVTGQQAPSGKNYLLVIGIDRYDHWPKLENAVKDARDVIDLLVRHYQFESEQVISLFDEHATEASIYKSIRDLKRRITPADNLLIYYSGHGHYDEEFDEGAWVPVDARQDTEDGYIKNVNIIHKLNAIDSHHTLLIVDSCFSGTLVVRKRAVVVDERFRSRRILASGRNETVSDGLAGANSPFAAGLLTFLRKNTDKAIKTTQLIEYVKDYLYTKARQTPVEGRLQNSKDEGGEFVFHLKMSESDLWQSIQKADTLKGYQNYLDAFPEGTYARAAERRILVLSEKDIWQSATVKDTEAAYENYIRKYPTGTFLAEARKKLEVIQEKREQRRKVLEEMAAKESERASIKGQYDHWVTQAEDFFQQRDLVRAREAYHKAQTYFLEGFVPNLEYIDEQLMFCANGIRFLEHYEQGKEYLKQGNHRLALEYFQEAQSIDDNPKLEDLIRYCRLKLHERTPSPIIEEEIRAELDPPPLPQRKTVADGQRTSAAGSLPVPRKRKRSRRRWGRLVLLGAILVLAVLGYQEYQAAQYDPVYSESGFAVEESGNNTSNGNTYSGMILGKWTLRDFTYDGQSIRNSGNQYYIDLLNMTMTFQQGNQMQYQDNSGALSYSSYYVNDQTGAITIQNYLGGVNGTINRLTNRDLTISFSQRDAYGAMHSMVMSFRR